MKWIPAILINLLFAPLASAQLLRDTVSFNFCGDTIQFSIDRAQVTLYNSAPDETAIRSFYNAVNQSDYQPVLNALATYREKRNPDDWLYYQLIRKTVEQISPKAANYYQYTLYKWFFLVKTGYNSILSISDNAMLFYIQSNDTIYNIPYRLSEGKQYVCLNYHDYGSSIDFDTNKFFEVAIKIPEAQKSFSYKLTHLPDFRAADYQEKDIQFNYYNTNYKFRIKLNPQVRTIFTNYPVVDYDLYFNIPLTKQTYESLIPPLKRNIKGMSKKNGVDYLMRFTRNAFSFEKDLNQFGREKRLSPEETLLYEYSDCEDRAALFFCLVKEIYDLPMIVVTFPNHVTIAVQLDKPVGTTIDYEGKKYSICEPTPQKEDLALGELARGLRNTAYEVSYVYNPAKN
jgi:hypothetical protein